MTDAGPAEPPEQQQACDQREQIRHRHQRRLAGRGIEVSGDGRQRDAHDVVVQRRDEPGQGEADHNPALPAQVDRIWVHGGLPGHILCIDRDNQRHEPYRNPA